MGRITAGIRLDYLLNVANAIAASKELERVIGAPAAKHVAVVAEDGRFRFKALTPTGEKKKEYTPEQKAQAAAIVAKLMKAYHPDHVDLPEVK